MGVGVVVPGPAVARLVAEVDVVLALDVATAVVVLAGNGTGII